MKRLHEYQELLAGAGVEWGLIGPREVDRLWDRHIDNCLAVTENADCLPQDSDVIDVGSGAGLPGLVWAIARPDLSVTLLEPLERRVKFLDMAVTDLELTNVSVVRGRAQDVNLTASRVTARALSALTSLLPILAPLVSEGGRMVLIKGQRADDEVTAASKWLTKNRWAARVDMVGTPPRTRVVVADRRV